MKFRHFLLTIGSIALLLKIMEKYTLEEVEEQTKVTFEFDLEPVEKGEEKYDDEEDSGDKLLDALEDMNEDEREKAMSLLSSELHQGEAVAVEKNLNKRQKKILKLFEKHDKIDTSLLSKKIPKVTVRTLRRDLDKLAELHLVEKIGKTKGVHYIRI
ncbi:DeoR family transcriptional regulator [Candidatus Dojkabacteria bacterium]|nr:DeoR family transcriptional regulator [Candidatus Dojkabacteria bacterium]